MKLSKVILIVLALVATEITESPFRKLSAQFGFFLPEQAKAAQCLAVSDLLADDKEHLLWYEAARARISDWIKNDSGCSTAMECVQLDTQITYWARTRARPNGGDDPDMGVIEKWRKSEYCQDLVASYQSALLLKDQANSLASPAIPNMSNPTTPAVRASGVTDTTSENTARGLTLVAIEIRLLDKPVVTEEGIYLKTDRGEFSMYSVNAQEVIRTAFNNAEKGQCLRLETDKEFSFSDASGIQRIEACR